MEMRGGTRDLARINVNLQRMLSLLLTVLQSPPVNHNPLEFRLRLILTEEQNVLRRALRLAQQQSFATSEFQTLIAIIYRDDEVAQLTVREWIRASTWARSADRDSLVQMEHRFAQMRRQLELIVPELTQIFGVAQMRYIVPAKYRDPPLEVTR